MSLRNTSIDYSLVNYNIPEPIVDSRIESVSSRNVPKSKETNLVDRQFIHYMPMPDITLPPSINTRNDNKQTFQKK